VEHGGEASDSGAERGAGLVADFDLQDARHQQWPALYPSGVNRLVGFLCFTETALLSMNLRVEPAFEDVTSHSDYGSGSSAQMGL
jgi:hypothetical protein